VIRKKQWGKIKMQNKTVIVTGGTSGIGRVLALELAKEGSNVVITGRNKTRLAFTENELKANGGNVLAVNADASVYADCKRVIDETINKFGIIHVLVNNAGYFPHKLLKDFEVEEWKKIIETNLYGPMMMCKEALPHMEKLADTTGATIINIASTSGRRGYETGTAYSASKFALIGFSESLFKEVRKHNIRVSIVYPSQVDTTVVLENEQKQFGKGVHMRSEDVADSIIAALKLPQRAMLKDIEIWGTNP
jgi:3-oxoacyl-[acyl-carrier protein] reductase